MYTYYRFHLFFLPLYYLCFIFLTDSFKILFYCCVCQFLSYDDLNLFFFFLAERGRISILKSTQAGETKLLVIVSQGESKWNTYFFLKSTSHTDETETLWEGRLPSHSSRSWASMFPQCGQGTMSSPRPLPPSLYWLPDFVPPPTLGQHHGRSTSAVSHSKGYLV